MTDNNNNNNNRKADSNSIKDTAIGKAGAIQGHELSRHSIVVLLVDCIF
jgi:hypothetical protein